jgi:hypothetical protein
VKQTERMSSPARGSAAEHRVTSSEIERWYRKLLDSSATTLVGWNDRDRVMLAYLAIQMRRNTRLMRARIRRATPDSSVHLGRHLPRSTR